MSRIEKLSIQGIRSFDPNTKNVIEFYTPLTLIVGQNGTGKTTVIECLKYITTGDMPSGSKSGSFINDPRVARENEVKAQVRLKFRNVGGREMVVVRSVQLTNKKSKLEQKTLESVLITTSDTGQAVSTNTKCSQLDADMPIYLGVGKAILENVVFCHQEDSNWPLSEPGSLKKKFDDIFAATRYTKALDSIKSVRKEHVAGIASLGTERAALKDKKGIAAKVRVGVEIVASQIELASKRVVDLTNGIDGASKEYQQLSNEFQVFQNLDSRCDTLKREKDLLNRQKIDLKKSLTCYSESDDQLMAILNEQRQRVTSARDNVKSLQKDRDETVLGISSIQRLLTEKATDCGKYQSLRDSQVSRIRERDAKILEIAVRLRIPNFDNARLSEDDVSRFTSTLESLIKETEGELTKCKSTNRQLESEITHKVQKLESDRKVKQDSKIAMRKSRQDNIKKLSELLNQVHKLSSEQTELDSKKMLMNQLKDDLDRAKSALDELDTDTRVKVLDSERGKVDLLLRQLKDEAVVLSGQSETRAKITLKRGDICRKEKDMRDLLTSYEGAITRLLGSMPSLGELPGKITALVEESELKVLKLSQEQDKFHVQSESIRTRLSIAKSELDTKSKKLTLLESEYALKFGDDDEYDSLLRRSEDDLSKYQRSLSICKGGSDVYQELADQAKFSKCCPLCDTNLAAGQLRGLFDKVSDIISLLPEQSSELQIKLDEAMKRRKDLLEFQSKVGEIGRLKETDVPTLKSSIRSNELKLDAVQVDLDDIVSELSLQKSQVQEVKSVQEKVEAITRIERDISQLKLDIVALEREITSDGSRTYDMVQSELENHTVKEKEIRHSIERLNSQSKIRQNDVIKKEKEYNSLAMECLKLEHRLGDIGRLHELREQLQKDNAQLEKDMVEIESFITDIEPQMSKLVSERAVINSEARVKEGQLDIKVGELRQAKMQIDSIMNQIKSFAASNIENKITQLNDQVDKLNQRLLECQKHVEQITDSINGMSASLSEFQVLERDIQDNFQYRRILKDIEAKESEIGELDLKRGRFQLKQNREQIDKLKAQIDKASADRAGLQGEIRQLELKRLEHETSLQTDYKDVENQYRLVSIKLKTSELASQDLDTYGKALDNAIMKYHSMKMEEINKIIKELWTSTYQGSDIDTIEIRSDAEKSRGNRSYNYRVVMIKGDAELDMRGRCSAGQKVLTSLIIRLALSETFCINCGILALDEPTTNLDSENIASLASALNQIVRMRRKQDNFQLIVITHDESFMQLLNKESSTDYYFRLSKDANQFSQIERQTFSSLIE